MSSQEIIHLDVSKDRLVAFAKEIPGARTGLKIAALLLSLEGQRPGWIADVLGLTRMSLNRWVRAVNAKGLEALKDKTRPGRPSRLTPQIAEQVEAHLERSPLVFGLNRARWDGPTLVEHLKRQYGLRMKVRQAQNWMHQLGYRLKRASYTYLQARREEAARFRCGLKKTSKSGASGDNRLPG
jgi:putative transposase